MRLPKFHRPTRRALLITISVIVAVALLATIGYFAIYWSGLSSLTDRDNVITAPESLIDDAENDGLTVVYKGETYRYNDSVISLLFMGVDKTDIHSDASAYGSNGQADSLFLATLNTKTGGVKVIPLSREMMADINLYDAAGTFIGTEKRQLCLAYAYASNAQEGCENVSRSVGRLLYGMPIDGYVAIDMEGLKALNKAVGGVTVQVLEDLSIFTGSTTITLVKGQTVTLDDHTVRSYIQLRGEDVNANDRRMQRQKQFLNEFIRTAANNIKKNFTLVEKYYTAAKPYAASDLTLSEITYLASTYLVGGQSAIEYISITGESKMVDEHVGFYADETSMYEAVLSAFYVKE